MSNKESLEQNTAERTIKRKPQKQEETETDGERKTGAQREKDK